MTHLTKVLVVVGILLLVGISSAAITTGAASAIGSNNVTVACAGATGEWTVRWGMTENVYWTSSEQPNAATSYRIHESPLVGNTLFYYQCCDSGSCGALATFTTASVTPLPTQTLGTMYENMTENGYDLPYLAANLITPYMWNSNMPITIIFMLIFSPIFLGVWLRSRSALVALLLGFITGGFILTANNSNIGISMPVEVIAIAQAMVYIAFAGSVLYILHR